MNLFFEPSKFISALPVLAEGMLIIFVIIGVIILSTMLTNKIFSKKK